MATRCCPLLRSIGKLRERRLSAAPISEPEIKRKLVLATRSDRPVSQAAGKLKKMLKQDLKCAIESGIWSGRSDKV